MTAAFMMTSDGTAYGFDAVITETHTILNDITEHPVERGANVTDHVRAVLDTIKLEVFISNAPVANVEGRQGFGQRRSVALPNVDTGASVLQFEESINNVAEMYRLLRKFRDEAELLQVITSSWDYQDMIVKEVDAPKTATEGDGSRMSIEFKQIRLVEARLVPSPLPAETRGKLSTDKGAQGAKDISGESGGVKKKSTAAAILDKF